MIIKFFYTSILFMVAPLFLWKLLKKKSNKPSIGRRWTELFGLTPPIASLDNPYTVWIHSVSVGETIAVMPLIKSLHKKHPEAKLVITTTTPTGAEQAKKLGGIAEHRYMPLDFPFAIECFINTVQPNYLIIMETELWPNTLMIAHKYGIKISVINARLSEKSYRNYARLAWLIKPCLASLEHIYCQTQLDKQRFKKLGVLQENLTITGSIKYDIDISQTTYTLAKTLRQELGTQRPVWIAASTHEGEDQLLLDSHKQILEKRPDALLILVPRHPERFQDVYHLVKNNNLNIIKRSDNQTISTSTQVYLADTMGEMLLLLGSSDVCFMGGSLIGSKVGGHNVLEPAAMGIPTIIGPSYFNFKEITLELAKHNALTVVNTPDDIATNILNLFTDKALHQTQSSNAIAFVENNRGAIEKTLLKLIT